MGDVDLLRPRQSSAPAIATLLTRSPGAKGPDGVYYARDSIIAVDELAVSDPADISKGLQWPVPKIAEAIIAMCDRWDDEPFGCADPAIFARTGHSSGSIANEFSQCGVTFQPSENSRIAGWSLMRTMFAACGAVDRPGLYVARHCSQFWQTAPVIGRDPRRIEDIDSRLNDHSCDSLRYGVMFERQDVRQYSWYRADRRA